MSVEDVHRGTLTLRSWSAEFDQSRDDDPPAHAVVDPNVEIPASLWRPLRPDTTPERTVLIVDGVQRIDSWADLSTQSASGSSSTEVVLASFAAGAVRAGSDLARVVALEVRRCAFCETQPPLLEGYAWEKLRSVDHSAQDVVNAAMTRLEVEVASRVATGEELVIIDGPLRRRDHLPGCVGYIKSHRVEYLTDQLGRIVAALAPGERTPLFALSTRWDRFAWYARLPLAGTATDPTGSPWLGIVRGEAAAALGVVEAVRLANRACVSIPRFASKPTKDPRAPQNLTPLGGLERMLRHRLGARDLLLRGVRRG